MEEKYFVACADSREPLIIFFNKIEAFISGYPFIDSFDECGCFVKSYEFEDDEYIEV